MMAEVLREQADLREWQLHKYPWYEILHNWTVAVLLLILLVATIVYAIRANMDSKVNERTATAIAEFTSQADTKAEEERKQAEYEAMVDAQSDAVAQLLFGIRNFEALYHYTEKDVETYVQSAFNRSDAREQDLVELIFEDGQYIACSKHNDITPEYKALAKKLVEAWHNGKLTCDTAYQYAELTPYGIYLRKGYGDERWHA